MPNYDYQCSNCGKQVRLFFTYAQYDSAEPKCTHCNSDKLKRLIGRVALAKSEDARLDSLDPDSMLAGVDEEDPRSLGKFMRKMSSEMGEDLGDEFDEVVNRLESGESPEEIEKTMPELADDGGSFASDDLI